MRFWPRRRRRSESEDARADRVSRSWGKVLFVGVFIFGLMVITTTYSSVQGYFTNRATNANTDAIRKIVKNHNTDIATTHQIVVELQTGITNIGGYANSLNASLASLAGELSNAHSSTYAVVVAECQALSKFVPALVCPATPPP